MWLSCFSVPLASRGFSATGNLISAPLSIATMIEPSRKQAERAVSLKVFMPLLYYKLLVLFGKLLGLRQFPDLQSLGFTQRDFVFDIEDGTALLAGRDFGVGIGVVEVYDRGAP
jgi:hypothetical protein